MRRATARPRGAGAPLTPAAGRTRTAPMRHPILALVVVLAACLAGGCGASVQVELCRRGGPEEACEIPEGGYAAGLGYELRVRGAELPPEIVFVVLALGDGAEAREVARETVRITGGARSYRRPFLLPELGRYRIEARTPDGAVLGRRDVQATVDTTRPAER